MTDEEIETELSAMVLELNWGTLERDKQGVPKHIAVVLATIDYINRLKTKCYMIDGLYRKSCVDHKIGISKQRSYWKNKVDQIRKETAKEMLSQFGKYNGELYGTCFYKGSYISDIKDLIKEIANDYDIEVDE